MLITESNRRWWLLAAVSCVLGLVLLDETVVGVALHTIQTDLGMSDNQAHWVVNSYLLVFACFVALGGKLGDQFGMLPVFLVGLVIFGLSSLAAGLAQSGTSLIVARALQGIGAAIIFPLYMAMTGLSFPPEQRGYALGIGGAIGTVFLALGPLVGGVLTDYLSWHWIFWINPPIVVLIGVVTFLTWRDVDLPKPPPIDWVGAVLIASGLFFLVFALMQGPDWGWNSPYVLWGFVLAVIILSLFTWIENRREFPLIELSLLRNARFTAANMTILTAQYGKMPIFVFGALFAQSHLGLDPFWAGALVMLAALPQPVIAPICGKMVDRHPKGGLMIVGLLSMGAGLAWIAVTVALDSVWWLVPGFLLAGLAGPFLFIPAQNAILSSLEPHKLGQAGGITKTAQMLGGTLGLAVSSVLFVSHENYALVFAVASALFFIHALICFRVFQPSSAQAA